MSVVLLRGNAQVPGPPLTPAAAVLTLSTSSLRITAAGEAPTGWLSWEIEESTTGTGSWSNISTGPSSFDKTGLGSGVTRYYRVRGTTNDGQVSGYSAVANGTTGTAPTGKKWNPGHYINPDANGLPAKDAQRFSCYDSIQSLSSVKGSNVRVEWGQVQTAAGVYDWSRVQADINRLTANRTNGKKAILQFSYTTFPGTNIPTVPQNPAFRVIPDDIVAGGGCAVRTQTGLMPRLDLQWVMDSMIAFFYAAAAIFDPDPYVEAFVIGEVSNAYAGMNSAAFYTQWSRVPINLKNAWPNTWTAIHNTTMVTQQQSADLADLMLENDIGIGGPDLLTFFDPVPDPGLEYGSWGFLRVKGAGSKDGYNYGTNDRRMEIPSLFEHQVIRDAGMTNATAFNEGNSYYKCTHMIWTLRIGAGGGSYNTIIYGTDRNPPAIPAPAEFSGDGTLAYLATVGAITRTAYPA